MAMRFAEMKKMYAALTDRLLFEPKMVRNGTEAEEVWLNERYPLGRGTYAFWGRAPVSHRNRENFPLAKPTAGMEFAILRPELELAVWACMRLQPTGRLAPLEPLRPR